MSKIFNQISGVIQVNVKGKKPEKVINMALARGIYIWGIKKVDENIEFKVRNSSIEALQNIAAESKHEIEIMGERGLPFLKHVLKRRLGFITGVLIFILALYFMSSFIWFIEVIGNENLKKEQIILIAAKHGVYQGVAKWNFSRSQVEEAILRDLSSLAYVEIDIRGVQAKIIVVEKILPKAEITGPCHVVATKNGVIEDVLVLEGQASVGEGDVVAKGDILISGAVIPEENPFFIPPVIEESDEEIDEIVEPKLVRARGIVKAKVWYEGYGECKLKSEEITTTNKKQTQIFLITPGHEFKLRGNYPKDFALADEEISEKAIKTPLGTFKLLKKIKREKTKKVIEYTEEEAVKMAKDNAVAILRKKLKDGQKVNTTNVEVLSVPSELILRVKVSMEVIENIAVAEPIIIR